jgi:autotransporter-associated beta strand protein
MNQTNPAPSHLRKQSPALAWMRQYLRVPVTGVLIASFSLWSAQVRGATLVWDGGTNTWDVGTTLNWNGGGAWANSNNNIALFGGTVGTVTLGAPITAGGLIFNSSGYTIASDTLTLAAPSGVQSPIIAVNNNGFGTNRATVSSLLAGTSGFTKTGNGTLVLSNNSNSFSGDIAIKGGSLVVTNAGQLGTGTTAISVTGIAQNGNPGYSGGGACSPGDEQWCWGIRCNAKS